MAQSQSYHFNRQIKGVELPTENVSGIVQNNEGLMWFNTANGIFYSDGFDTYPLPKDISDNLSNKLGLFTDNNSDVWIYNQVDQPTIYHNQQGEWKKFELPTFLTNQISRNYFRFYAHRENEQEFYIAISNNFLAYSSNGENWEVQVVQETEVGPYKSFFRFNEEMFIFFNNQTFRFRNNTFEPFEFENADLYNNVHHMSYDESSKTFYFLGKDYLAKGNSYLSPSILCDRGFSKDIFSSINHSGMTLSRGRVFYFFNSQLHKYNPDNQEVTEISIYDNTKSYHIYAACVDREDIIWIGSHRGMTNLNSLRFTNYNSQYLLDDEVTAIVKLIGGGYLLGFNEGLQYWRDFEAQTYSGEPGGTGKPSARITNFSEDKNGIVWFSSNLSGLGRFDPATKAVSFTPNPEKKFVTCVEAIGDSLFVVSRDKIYLSSIDNPASSHFENEITNDYLQAFGEEEVFIRKIGKLKDGKLIFMQGGNPLIPEGLIETDSFINVIGFDYLESGDTLYLATETGLKFYHKGKLENFVLKEKSINRPVYALLKDSSGKIWVGTDKGVFVISDGIIRQFDERNGLAGSETNRGALVEADGGRVFIGTQKGLSIFNPLEDLRVQVIPLVSIYDVQSSAKGTAVPDLTEIPAENNIVTFFIRVVSFYQNSTLKLRYKLDGYHEDWIEVVDIRTNTLAFENLPPGKFRLYLQAGVVGQEYSSIITSEDIRVLKPYYLNWWFIILVLLIFFGIGFLMNMVMTQYRNQAQMKKVIDEKVQEAMVSEDQLRSVWDNSKDGLMLSVEGGKIIGVNPAMPELTGIPLNVLEKYHISDLYTDPDFYETSRSKFVKMIESSDGKGVTIEMAMPFKAGLKEIELYVTFLKSKYQGKMVIFSVFRDITGKKENEKNLMDARDKAEEASRLKSNFLSNMSHEIRTPLNGILGSTENIIMQRKDDHMLVSQLEIIQESGERLLQTINGILDLAKIESNKMGVVKKQINVNDFMAKILLPLKSLAIKKGLLITVKYETQPFVGNIDKRYFEMILNNIVGNAIKYSDRGLVSIRIKKENEMLRLEVKDQGIGMSEEFKQYIFKPFEQESHGYGRTFEGTGLGLTITKNLIDLLEGTIDIESSKDTGTLVIVRFPLEEN